MFRFKCGWLVGIGLFVSRITMAGGMAPLESCFNDTNIWALTAEDAYARWAPHGFAWTEKTQRNSLRWFSPVKKRTIDDEAAPASNDTQPVEVLGRAPVEVIFKFQNDTLLGMMALFYARGDSGNLRMNDYLTLVQFVTARLDAWAGAKGAAQKGDSRGDGAIMERMVWTRDGVRADLEWGCTRPPGTEGRPEFVRVRFVQFNPAQRAQLMSGRIARENVAPTTSAPDGMAGAIALKSRVEKRANGDHLLNVPMVDQGPKGYCVAAVLERVARYFGREFDQHEAAQLADTTAEEGTSSDNLIAGLRKMAAVLKMRCAGKTDIDDTASFVDPKQNIKLIVPKEFAAMLKIYNREAKKADKPEYEVWELLQGGGLDAIYQKMDKDILRRARLAQKNEMGKFHADVMKNIDAGVPLVWAVLVGVVKEAGLPSDDRLSGHMRMIVGYNPQTKEIIYSDTWGPGHEEKRMSFEDAWVINKGCFIVMPQNIRF